MNPSLFSTWRAFRTVTCDTRTRCTTLRTSEAERPARAGLTRSASGGHPRCADEVTAGTGMHPVVFEGTTTPYVDDKSKRLAYSFRAAAMVAAQVGGRQSAGNAGAASPGDRAA